ncbi:hypothetical protein PHISP_00345 [Aspergillus sp. HF37]|nr:hypothetical protein PHISP_00345 [Aspergillus sp. HF37]
MYHAADPHDLHCMSQLARYESDEEDVSESDHAFSPVDSQRAPGAPADALDSDLSADESSIPDVVPHLLSPYRDCPEKNSRPVSMDTVKGSSGPTLVGDSFHLDHDDNMIVELPPTVYVPQPSESKHQHLSRSASGASVFSDEEPADLLVAEKVTYMEPHTRPNVIIISPFAGQSGPGPDPRVSTRLSQETKRAYRNSSVNSMGEIEIPQQEPADDASSLADISEDRDLGEREDAHARLPPIDTTTPTPPQDSSDTDLSPRAILPERTTAPSDTTPATHAISSQPQPQPQPQPSQRPISFSRPFADKTGLPARPRITADTSRRPPSVRSTSSASTGLYTPSALDSPYPGEDTRSRAGSSALNLTMSNSSSPAPNFSSSTFYRGRMGSAYSATTTTTTASSSSSTLGTGAGTGTGRSPYLLRNQAVKHSAAASTSAASLRSGSDGPGPEEKSLKKKASRGKSLRRMRHKSGLGTGTGPEDDGNGEGGGNTGECRERDQRHGSLASSSSSSSLKGFGFMGLGKLGRKKTTLSK